MKPRLIFVCILFVCASLLSTRSTFAQEIDDFNVDGLESPNIAERTCITATVKNRLSEVYGAVIKGTAYSCTDLQVISRVYKIAFSYRKYALRLKPETKFTITMASKYPNSNKCSGIVAGSSLTLYDFDNCSAYFDLAKYLILHETAHIIKNRNYSLFYSNYPHSSLISQDRNCYDRNYLKSYNYRVNDNKSESMAEASALFILNKKVGAIDTIYDFKNDCDATYRFIHENLYGSLIPLPSPTLSPTLKPPSPTPTPALFQIQ